MQAYISSISKDGYCFKISSGVSPALKNSKIVCAVILMPLMQGLPPHTAASTVILLFKYSIFVFFTKVVINSDFVEIKTERSVVRKKVVKE